MAIGLQLAGRRVSDAEALIRQFESCAQETGRDYLDYPCLAELVCQRSPEAKEVFGCGWSLLSGRMPGPGQAALGPAPAL